MPPGQGIWIGNQALACHGIKMPNKKSKRKNPGQKSQVVRAPKSKGRPRQRNQLFSTVGKTIGGILGSNYGPTGSAVGSLVGDAAGRLISHVTGRGDYMVSANSLLPDMNSQIPQFGMIAGGTRIRHREYVQDINSSVLFNNNAFVINPANVSLFPWLSTIAQRFEQWKPMGIILEFKSLYSDAVVSTAATASLGAVIMATEYNVLANRFNSKIQMENTQFVTSNKPSLSFLHPIECMPSQSPNFPLYVRPASGFAVSGDDRLYDLGLFQLATQGLQGDGIDIGELWITYDIELYKPVLDDLNTPTTTSHLLLQNVQLGAITGNGVLGFSNNFSINELSLTTSTNVINFPINSAGYYEVYVRWGGVPSTTVDGLYPFIAVFNCNFLIPIVGTAYLSNNLANSAVYATLQATPSVGGTDQRVATNVLQVLSNDTIATIRIDVPSGPYSGYPQDPSFGDVVINFLGFVPPV